MGACAMPRAPSVSSSCRLVVDDLGGALLRLRVKPPSTGMLGISTSLGAPGHKFRPGHAARRS